MQQQRTALIQLAREYGINVPESATVTDIVLILNQAPQALELSEALDTILRSTALQEVNE